MSLWESTRFALHSIDARSLISTSCTWSSLIKPTCQYRGSLYTASQAVVLSSRYPRSQWTRLPFQAILRQINGLAKRRRGMQSHCFGEVRWRENSRWAEGQCGARSWCSIGFKAFCDTPTVDTLSPEANHDRRARSIVWVTTSIGSINSAVSHVSNAPRNTTDQYKVFRRPHPR